MQKKLTVMFMFLQLCMLLIIVTAQNFKSFDKENAFLVVATKDILSHEEARAKCKALDSDLAVIKSPQALDFVLKLIHESALVAPRDSLRHFRVGLKKEQGQEKWVDGTKVVDSLIYFLSSKTQPGHCGALLSKQGTLDDSDDKPITLINCTGLSANYICHDRAARLKRFATSTRIRIRRQESLTTESENQTTESSGIANTSISENNLPKIPGLSSQVSFLVVGLAGGIIFALFFTILLHRIIIKVQYRRQAQIPMIISQLQTPKDYSFRPISRAIMASNQWIPNKGIVMPRNSISNKRKHRRKSMNNAMSPKRYDFVSNHRSTSDYAISQLPDPPDYNSACQQAMGAPGVKSITLQKPVHEEPPKKEASNYDNKS